jgi:hypothetical protein
VLVCGRGSLVLAEGRDEDADDGVHESRGTL